MSKGFFLHVPSVLSSPVADVALLALELISSGSRSIDRRLLYMDWVMWVWTFVVDVDLEIETLGPIYT